MTYGKHKERLNFRTNKEAKQQGATEDDCVSPIHRIALTHLQHPEPTLLDRIIHTHSR